MFEIKISEPKTDKSGLVGRKVKQGGRLLGTIEMPRGKPSVFWCTDHIARRSSVDQRILMVRRSVLLNVRRTCPHFVGIRFADGTTYKMPYMDLVVCAAEGDYFIAYEDKWEAEIPPEEVRVESVMGKMRIPGGRRKSSLTASS